MNNTKIANGVFLLYAGSIVSSLLIGTLVLKESLTAKKLVSIILCFIGIVFVNDPSTISSLALFAGLSSGALDGVGNALRKTIGTANRLTVLRYQTATSALFIGIVTILVTAEPIKTVSIPVIALTVVYGALLIWIGNLLIYGFSHFDVNAGTIILATEIIFAAILGYIFLSESLTLREVTGGFIILAAAVIVAMPKSLFAKRTP